MSPKEEISSTERLLHVIRGKKGPSVKAGDGVAKPSGGTRPKGKSGKGLSRDRATTVGVDIGASDVKAVRIRHVSDREWKLMDFRRFPIPPGVRDIEKDLSQFLKGSLEDFGVSKKEQIWTTISYIEADIRHIRIPKVPKKQMINAIYWTAKKESSFDEDDMIFDFAVHGGIIEKGIPKTLVMVYTAGREKVEERKHLFDRAGFPLTGITVAPFAIQNFFASQWISTTQESIATLYIGNDHSRIDIFSEGKLVLTRGIKFGTNGVVEAIAEDYHEMMERLPEASSHEEINGAVGLGSRPKIELAQARKILLSIIPDSPPLTETDPGYSLTEKDIYRVMLPAVDRLVRQVERTFEHCAMTYGTAGIGKIHMSWMLEDYRPIINYIGEQLGIEKDVLDPLDPGHPFVSDAMPPQSLQERTSFNMAVGLALSSNAYTPNALFTYREKEEENSVRRINMRIFVCFIGVIALCVAGYLWQLRAEDIKGGTVKRLRNDLNQYSVGTDENTVLQMAGKVVKNQKHLKEGSKRYLGMAVINELSQRTPSNIQLLNITVDLVGIPDASKKNGGGNMVMEGIITGEREILESALAQFMIRLEGSPLFSAPAVHKSEIESRQPLGEVLRFIMKMSLVSLV
ncbi:MAG: pilus assembly protein PilM [Pseudomonadota bacterium]